MSKYYNFEIEPQEVLLDRLASQREEEMSFFNKRLYTSVLKGSVFKFLFIVFFTLAILYIKTFQIQILQHKELQLKAEANHFFNLKIKSERGVIYDKNLKQLVYNRPYFDLIVKKSELPKDEKYQQMVFSEIASILNVSEEFLKEKIYSNPKEEVILQQNIDHKTLIILQTKLNKLAGFEVKKRTKREYVEGEIMFPVVGYVSKTELEGKDGIEKYYDFYLQENAGQILVERDAMGRIMSKKIVETPKAGKNVVLWLDLDLQKKIKEEIEKKIKEVRAKAGSAVVMDVNTGGILALVSSPSIDSNLFSSGLSIKEWEALKNDEREPLLNRAIAGQYLLGSTIKPFIALAALHEKIISPTEKIYCSGGIEIQNPYNPDVVYRFGDWTVQGPSDVRKAIAESCNVFFYTVGGGYKEKKGLGIKKIKEYLELFGFGEMLNVDFPIPPFATGLIGDPVWKKEKLKEGWWDGDTYNISIGQGYIMVTPLQLARAYAAIANEGKLLKPKFAKAIIDDNGNIIENMEPEIEREIPIDKKYFKIVKEGMRWAVTGENSPYASALSLNEISVPVAAKTGTAQVPKKGCSDCYNIWISVFAPYDNPQIVLVIMLEDVKGILSQVVVPVAKEVLSWYFHKERNF